MANPEDLGRYRLKRLLGRGALGEVWEASDIEREGEKVAVKIMHAADEELTLARTHFAREARLAALMNHPHVAIVHDSGEAAGTSFIVMEMVEGRSLRAMLADASTTLADKLAWLDQMARGLAALHRAGLAHRDLKPENVIVRADGSACLVDLGIAKWTRFNLGGVLYAPDDENEFENEPLVEEPAAPAPYVPPETIDRSLYDDLGDQYAWGIVAYEALTGAVPGDDASPLADDLRIPRRIATAIDRARSKERDERWGEMPMLIKELSFDTGSLEAAAESFARDGGAPPSSRRGSARSGEGPPAALRALRGGRAVKAALAESPEGPGFSVVIAVAIVFIGLVAAVLMALRPA